MLPKLKIIYKEPAIPKTSVFYTVNKFLKYLEMSTSFPGLYNFENNDNLWRWTVQYNVEHTRFGFIRIFDNSIRSLSNESIENENNSIQPDIVKKLISLSSSVLNNTVNNTVNNSQANGIPVLTLISQNPLEYSIVYVPISPTLTFQQYVNLFNNPPYYFIAPGTYNEFINSFFPVNPIVSGINLSDQFWWINMPDDFNYLGLFLESFNRNYNNTYIWYISDNGKTGIHKKNINKWFGFDGVHNILYPPSDNLMDVLPAILLYWWIPDNFNNLTISNNE